MRIRRIIAAAAERNAVYDGMTSGREAQRLFSCGALYFATLSLGLLWDEIARTIRHIIHRNGSDFNAQNFG